MAYLLNVGGSPVAAAHQVVVADTPRATTTAEIPGCRGGDSWLRSVAGAVSATTTW
ncbi:hypothetical protein FMEAI12_3640078 [Parafrankia sp. Ea1.12]|nr:hypothetical protein FMEAI12_3640078 [Parafrankia sp. Ea1.12]